MITTGIEEMKMNCMEGNNRALRDIQLISGGFTYISSVFIFFLETMHYNFDSIFASQHCHIISPSSAIS